MSRSSNLVGLRVKNITVVARAGSAAWVSMWLVRCVCGHHRVVPRRTITTPPKTLRIKCPRCEAKLCPTKIAYRSMLQRGRERGIRICARWRNSYDAFVQDMGLRPPKMVLDRINNEDGYRPLNCRWASYKLSTENRRNTVWLRHKGRRIRVNDFAALVRLPHYVVRQRLSRGWTTRQIAANESPFDACE